MQNNYIMQARWFADAISAEGTIRLVGEKGSRSDTEYPADEDEGELEVVLELALCTGLRLDACSVHNVQGTINCKSAQ